MRWLLWRWRSACGLEEALAGVSFGRYQGVSAVVLLFFSASPLAPVQRLECRKRYATAL